MSNTTLFPFHGKQILWHALVLLKWYNLLAEIATWVFTCSDRDLMMPLIISTKLPTPPPPPGCNFVLCQWKWLFYLYLVSQERVPNSPSFLYSFASWTKAPFNLSQDSLYHKIFSTLILLPEKYVEMCFSHLLPYFFLALHFLFIFNTYNHRYDDNLWIFLNISC